MFLFFGCNPIQPVRGEESNGGEEKHDVLVLPPNVVERRYKPGKSNMVLGVYFFFLKPLVFFVQVHSQSACLLLSTFRNCTKS